MEFLFDVLVLDHIYSLSDITREEPPAQPLTKSVNMVAIQESTEKCVLFRPLV